VSKRKVIVFTSNNAGILTNPDMRPYVGRPNVLIDPDLSKVQGIAPHYWKLSNGNVVPLSPPEKLLRDRHIRLFGLDSDFTSCEKQELSFHRAVLYVRYLIPGWLLGWGIGLLMGALGMKWLTSGLGILGL
jgi:hypothetical protein